MKKQFVHVVNWWVIMIMIKFFQGKNKSNNCFNLNFEKKPNIK
jgi:hypothetical protein